MFTNLASIMQSNKTRAETFTKKESELLEDLKKVTTAEEKQLIKKRISKLRYNFDNAW